MPTKPQSWKKVRNERRHENFVGRADQLRVFSDNYVGDVPKYMVFAVTGEGGVGKSTLLTQYEALARSPSINANVIVCDDRQLSPASAMGYIAGELAKSGIVHKGFDERYKKYRDMRQEIEGDAKAPRSWVNMLAFGVSDLTIKSLRTAPGVGALFEYADEKAVGTAFAELVNYGINRWGNKDEVQLLREPEIILTPLFLELLNDACARQPIVLMFDVFERTCETLSPWLLALFDFEYGEFTTRLTFVVSGRDPLEQHWTELAGALCRVPLEPFTLDETRLYLSNQDITDERLVTQIHSDTGGLPVLVELLAATKPQPGVSLPDISKDAVERFLQWTPQEERRQAALLAAVPRQFNRDILSAALGNDATGMFNWLTAQSYIRTNTERGCFYHEKVRELMLRHLRNTHPRDLTATHAQLVTFFEEAQKQLDIAGKAAYNSGTWREWERERVYHTLSERPDRNLAIAVNAFFQALRWRQSFAEQIVQTCRQVSQEAKSKAAGEMAETLAAIYGAYDQNNYELGIKKLEPLAAIDGLTDVARSVCYNLSAWMYSALGNYQEGLRLSDQAIALDPKEPRSLVIRGETCRLINDYDRALADFDRAIALDPTSTNAITRRALTYRQKGDYDRALADFDRSIELDPKDDWAIAARGETYRLKGKYRRALADFDQAIALNPELTWAFAARGEICRSKGDYDRALADFDQAIALDPKLAWAIAARGEIYRSKGDYDRALADFDRAIALDPKNDWAIASRGETYRLKGDYDRALADFDRAIALDPKNDWAIDKGSITYANRGKAYCEKGDYARALVCFDRAITLDPENASIIAQRGETYRQKGDYDRALVDFDQAITLDSGNASIIAQRGETYRQKGEYDRALVDFDQAIELAPKVLWGTTANLTSDYFWVIAARGLIYRQQGDYARALADFDRAIELDPRSARTIAGRGIIYRVLGQETAAMADLRAAIDKAQEVETQTPDNWENKLCLALYYVASGDQTAANGLYQAAIDASVNEGPTRETIHDLDDYLHLFPSDDTAREIRKRLQRYVEERFPKADQEGP